MKAPCPPLGDPPPAPRAGPSLYRAPGALTCHLAAHAQVRVPAEGLADLRRQLARTAPLPGIEPPSPAFLKHADEQTVAGLAAVFEGVRALTAGGEPPDFRAWGVLGAPRFLGRAALAQALPRFLAEGAWGVSPHVIPHRLLHSVSGAISQALRSHGPNFGVGGGPDAEAEVLLAALTLLDCRRLPGVWVVLSSLDPDITPNDSGLPPPGSTCVALALALTPVGPAQAGTRLWLGLDARVAGPPERFDLIRLAAFLDAVETGEPGTVRVAQGLGAGFLLELSREAGEEQRSTEARE